MLLHTLRYERADNKRLGFVGQESNSNTEERRIFRNVMICLLFSFKPMTIAFTSSFALSAVAASEESKGWVNRTREPEHCLMVHN